MRNLAAKFSGVSDAFRHAIACAGEPRTCNCAGEPRTDLRAKDKRATSIVRLHETPNVDTTACMPKTNDFSDQTWKSELVTFQMTHACAFEDDLQIR